MSTGPEGPSGAQWPEANANWEVILRELRSAVASRMDLLSARQAMQTWDRRRSDPLSPYVVVWFFAEPTHARFELKVAYRVWFEADTENGAPRLLYEVTQAVAVAKKEQRDMRTLATTIDQMSDQAWFFGVGLASLDTPEGTWKEIKRQAGGATEVPGRCYVRTVDDTWMLIDRFTGQRFGVVDIQSSQALQPMPGHHRSKWRYFDQYQSFTETESHIWQRLAELCDVSSDQ